MLLKQGKHFREIELTSMNRLDQRGVSHRERRRCSLVFSKGQKPPLPVNFRNSCLPF